MFYLNGAELYRFRMPQTTILNNTIASGYSCSNYPTSGPLYGDACTVCPDVFTVPAASLTNLVQGDNLLAVEVHNYSAGSPDLVFGSALFLNTPLIQQPKLNAFASDGQLTLWWNGPGFTLQQASELGPNASWSDEQGPITSSPYTVLNPVAARFYRLRK